MSSPCSSDSEDDKIITSSMEKRETLTRRKEAEPQRQKVTTQSGTTRNASKASVLNFLKFWKSSDNPAGWAYNHVEHFMLDSIRLIRRCTKPDTKEFKKIAYACGIGFLLMGFIGYIVKLVFIPINNILVSE